MNACSDVNRLTENEPFKKPQPHGPHQLKVPVLASETSILEGNLCRNSLVFLLCSHVPRIKTTTMDIDSGVDSGDDGDGDALGLPQGLSGEPILSSSPAKDWSDDHLDSSRPGHGICIRCRADGVEASVFHLNKHI